MADIDSIYISILLLGGLTLLLDVPDRCTWARAVAVALLSGLTLAYVHCRYTDSLPVFATSPRSLWPWIYFGLELVAITFDLWAAAVLIRVSDHSAEADVLEYRLRQQETLPTIAVFIPTFSESVKILTATIEGMLAMEYPRSCLQICVLDDGKGRDPESIERRRGLKDLCRRRGVGYIRRPGSENAKAGNLNYALERTQSDLIAVFDADHIPKKNFLFRVVGFLLWREDVALVQTPQSYFNPDPCSSTCLGRGPGPRSRTYSKP